MRDTIAEWFLSGKTASEIGDAVTSVLKELQQTHATKAVVIGPMPGEFEYTTLEDAEERVMQGELHVCDDDGLHFGEDGESVGYNTRVYHTNRVPTDEEMEAFILSALDTIEKSLGLGDAPEHYGN